MAINRSKRYRAAAEKVDGTKTYPLAEAITLLKSLPPTKFDQTVTLSFRLGVDPRQSDQMVRGTCPLPHGSGKVVRVLVFAQGAAATAAKEAGAEYVGFEDLVKKCQEGFQDFDVANPKTGTVTDDTAKAVKEVKAGRVEFKLDKNGNVAVPVGKFSFDSAALSENGAAVIEAVVKARPSTAKGTFIQNVTLSATMLPGMRVDATPFLKV
jgi:large subunit ribosomal protein L1